MPHKTFNQSHLNKFKRLKSPLTHQYDQVLMNNLHQQAPRNNQTRIQESIRHSRDHLIQLPIIHTTQIGAVAQKISTHWAWWAAPTTQHKSFKLSLWAIDSQNQPLRRARLRLVKSNYSSRAYSTKIPKLLNNPLSPGRHTSAPIRRASATR